MLRLKCYTESFYVDIVLKQIKLWNTFAILSQFLVKNIVEFTFIISPSAFRPKLRFHVKLICCITFGSDASACPLLKSIGIIL